MSAGAGGVPVVSLRSTTGYWLGTLRVPCLLVPNHEVGNEGGKKSLFDCFGLESANEGEGSVQVRNCDRQVCT